MLLFAVLLGVPGDPCRSKTTSPPSLSRSPPSPCQPSPPTPPGSSAPRCATSPLARILPLVIDVRRFGTPHQRLFYCALAGTTPDNQRWVERKINVVARFHKSSYHVGRLLEQSGLSFSARYGLPEEDYAAHGGCFPLNVAGAGIVGAVTVSGLPQRDDHNLVVEALCLVTGRDHEALRLQP